jgi:hypothetical protein
MKYIDIFPSPRKKRARERERERHSYSMERKERFSSPNTLFILLGKISAIQREALTHTHTHRQRVVIEYTYFNKHYRR